MTFVIRPETAEIAQKLTASYYRNPKIALLTVKTGGGKTYGAIHTFGQMFNQCTLLVFTTSKVANSKQWETSVKDYNKVMQTNITIVCYNYEKLLSQKFLNAIAKKLSLVQNQPIILVLDEVHRIKLASSGKFSKRAKILIKLARQPYITTVLGLSATAFSNSYLDVATYLIMAGYYTSKTNFLQRHVKRFDDYYNPIVKDRYGNISRDAFKDPDLIDYELSLITSYVDTSKYLPELTSMTEQYNLPKSAQSLYQQIQANYEAGFYDKEAEDGSIRPCWSCARSDQEALLANDFASQKDLFVLNLLKRQVKGEFNGIHPILIFYQYTIVCQHLHQLLTYAAPEYQIVEVNGRSHLTQAELTKPAADKAIYLVQYEAGGEGLDWQWSNISIFYEAPVRYEKFVQAAGRNLRNKDLMPKVYHFSLEYLKSYDSERWQTNREKKDFTKDVSRRTFLKNVKPHKITKQVNS